MTKPLPSDFAGLEAELRRGLRGDVRLDQLSRWLYATDASIYQQQPVGVVLPRDELDLAHALRVAHDRRLPVLPRGAGTSLAGQATGAAIVIDTSKYMNRIVDFDAPARRVRVEPGVIRDQLNQRLAPSGLHFAPETATSNRACIGGMIGNNSSGAHAIRFGKTSEHYHQLVVRLVTGERLTLESLSPDQWAARSRRPGREGLIYRGLQQIVDRLHPEIARRYPKVIKRVAGYRLDAFRPGQPWNLADLVLGSEGTLCVVTEATLSLEPLPGAENLSVLHFADLIEALRAVPAIVEHGPTAVELLDRNLMQMARGTFGSRWRYNWLVGDPAAVLLVEFAADDRAAADGARQTLLQDLTRRGIGYAQRAVDGGDVAEVWEVRKAGLGLLASINSDVKPVAFIEDTAVPVQHLADYIGGVLDLCRRESAPVTLYAHASVGLLHVRPMLDLRRADDIERMKRISSGAFQLARRFDGCFSGEHGDGRARSYVLPEFYGPEIYRAFEEIKRLFDPLGLMNPGKIVNPAPIDEDLRLGADHRSVTPETHFHYRQQRSLAAAAEQCTGVGACRKLGAGTMCPSYMATREEKDSTRGRANALRLALAGKLGRAGLASAELQEVFDLCLACKSCKSECPSSVDVAKLKAEFLAAFHAHHGPSLADRFYGYAPQVAAAVCGPLAPLINRTAASQPVRRLLEQQIGLDRRRPLPPFASQSFARWFARHKRRPAATEARRVALFADTFLNYHEPALGRAAVAVLEAFGFDVELLDAGCCGRTLISRGLLAEAARQGEQTMRNVVERLERGRPVVVCEPGCFSSLVDDLPDLIADAAIGQRVAAGVKMIDHFLLQQVASGAVDVEALRRQARPLAPRRYLVHVHCHQQAIGGGEATRRLLSEVSGAPAELLDAGCCGMAGSFGYEKQHYELSLRIAEDRLFPAIRQMPAGSRLVACGFSCRHQIADGLSVSATHLVEELARLLG